MHRPTFLSKVCLQQPLEFKCTVLCGTMTASKMGCYSLPWMAGLSMLSDLRAGWCSSVGNEDIMPLTSLAALTLLELSRTQVWQAFVTSPCLHIVLVQAVPICMPYAVLHKRSMPFEYWSNDYLLHHRRRAPDAVKPGEYKKHRHT